MSTYNGSVSVSTEGLQDVAKNLLTKRDEINDVYNSKIKNIFENSKEAIVVSGLDYSQVEQSISKSFQELDTSLEKLSKALTDEIIPNYNSLAQTISKYFNSDFASDVQSILNL